MPNIANLSLAQLRAATKAQIVTAIANYLTNNYTKRQIITFLIDRDTIPDPPARTYRADGQIQSETDTSRDAETGAIVATRQTTWTYYPSGEVDTITLTEGATTRMIKHYLDGQPPRTTTRTTVMPAIQQPEQPPLPLLLIPALLAIAVPFLVFFLSR